MLAMAPSISSLTHCWGSTDAAFRRDAWRSGLIAAFHLAALALMALSEVAIVPKAVFLLSWGMLNFFWIALLRRPAVSAALSLVMIVALILLSQFKYNIISMTANFLDVWIIDNYTVRFLLMTIPGLTLKLAIAGALTIAFLGLLWRLDRFRVRLQTAVIGLVACLTGIAVLSITFPQEDWEGYFGDSYVSKFSRSGVATISALMMHGYMESDAVVADRLKMLPDATCRPIGKPPHIILVHDESSFDIRVAPGIKVPAGYGPHFRSFDGRERRFIAEGAGGPSWYSEYNVLSGLSARSFGRFAYYVTRIAAGRVERGLPSALRLSDILDLSGARRLHEREELPDHDRCAEVLRPELARHRSGRAGPILL